jgi:hypothetical protein
LHHEAGLRQRCADNKALVRPEAKTQELHFRFILIDTCTLTALMLLKSYLLLDCVTCCRCMGIR